MTARDVSAWAVDADSDWIPSSASGLAANEAGFGGIERFPHYGACSIQSSPTSGW